MPARVAISTILPYAIGILGVAAIVYAIDDRAFRSGVKQTTDQYEAAMDAERERLQEANEAALREAREKEQQLRDQLDERNEIIQQILQEGLIDPDAGRRSLGTGSVSRINTIR